jgi:fructose/tagatose bisphosphate aldolase
MVLLVFFSFLGTYLNPSKHIKVMKEKKKTPLVMYGDHKSNWQETSSCIGWELPETRK